MSRYNDNNPQHRKELHEYLTRPKADSKGAFRSFTQAKIAEKKKEKEYVHDPFLKNLINLGNRHGDHQYIVDNDTGEVVTEADLKRRFTYQDKPFPKQATPKQMAELKTKVDKYKDIHFPKEKPFKDKTEAKKPVPEIPIEIPKFNPNLFKIPKEKPKPIVRALPPEHDPKYRNTIFGSDVYYRRKKKLDF